MVRAPPPVGPQGLRVTQESTLSVLGPAEPGIESGSLPKQDEAVLRAGVHGAQNLSPCFPLSDPNLPHQGGPQVPLAEGK